MRHFTIVPIKRGETLDEISAVEETGILHAVSNLVCDEAAIFEDEVYRYSLFLDAIGCWHIFQRLDPLPKRRS